MSFIDFKHSGNTLGEIGGKARGLFFLKKHAFNTPEFFVLPFSLLHQIETGEKDLGIIIHSWKAQSSILESDIWAVRSSAENEDGRDQSMAGCFLSKINVKTEDLVKAIAEVLESYSRVNTKDPDEKKNNQYGIIIQRMIRSEYSGVIFSHNPMNIQDETIHINVVPGLNENLVSGRHEAFEISVVKGEQHYKSLDEVYFGEVFSDRIYPVNKTGEEIVRDIRLHLDSLIKGTQKLASLQKQPVDIEFTIAGGTLYWLQIRPITTGKEVEYIWDNTAAEGNYPGILLPLSISLIQKSFYLAYRNMAAFIGMPGNILKDADGLTKNMVGEINGGLYYNVTAWQQLLYLLPFGKSAANSIIKIWGMQKTAFHPRLKTSFIIKFKLFFALLNAMIQAKSNRNKFNVFHEKVLREFSELDLKSCRHDALISMYSELENKLVMNSQAPMLNNLFSVFTMMLLKQAIKRSKLNDKYPNFINDVLYAQGDIISIVILREYQDLIAAINSNADVLHLFKSDDNKYIFERLDKDFPEIFERLTRYIENYGERSEEPELKMETVNYKEDPLSMIVHLKKNVSYNPAKRGNAEVFDYREILKNEYPVNVFVRGVFLKLIQLNIKRIRDRENFRFMRTKIYGLIRQIFREMDNRLLESGLILNKNDSLFLTVEELTNSALSSNYQTIIEERKLKYKSFEQIERATRYIQKGKTFAEVSDEIDLTNDNTIRGVGCCSGKVKGKVKILDSSFFESTPIDGSILISHYFEPGQLSLFSQAAGLISIRGNLLGHTAILCREMGIPSIVGAKGLLSKVKDGDWIEMDGATGKINILQTDE